MSKPTLVQSLLNRPSQTYSTQIQQRNEYHSAKQELLRMAAVQSPEPSLSEYFTPDTSPRTSMTTTSRKPSRRSLSDRPVPSTRTPSASSSTHRAIYTLSTGSSLSSTSLDGHSIFSDYLSVAGSVDELHKEGQKSGSSSTATTNVTTTTTIVPASAYGMSSTRSTVTPKRSGKNTSTKAGQATSTPKPRSVQQQGRPIAKEQERQSKKSLPQPNGVSQKPFNAFAPLPSTTTTRQAPSKSTTSTRRPQTNGIPKKPSSTPNGHLNRELPPPPKPPSSQTISSYNNRRHNSTSKMQPSLLMNMSALIEEDEDLSFIRDIETDGLKKRHTLRHTTERGRERRRSEAPASLASSSSSGSVTATPGPKKPAALNRRRSRSLDSGSSPRPPPQTLSSEVQALTLASHRDIPSNGTQGFTPLVLPRAPVPLSGRPAAAGAAAAGGGFFGQFSFGLPNLNKLSLGTDGKVDLTRSGVAQTTMASVEVVRGLSSKGGGGGGGMLGRSASWKVKEVLGALGRRGSTSRPSGRPPISSDGHVAKSNVVLETRLGFTSYRTPPSYLPSRSVLVQVWAVGVDGVDGRLVGVRFGSGVTKKSEWGEFDDDDDNDYDDDDDDDESHDEDGEGYRVRDDEQEEREDDPVTRSTASQNLPSKNPFVALGRSLSLSLRRPKKDQMERQTPQRSFSLRTHKHSELTPGPGNGVGPTTNVHTPASRTASASSSPEKRRSGGLGKHPAAAAAAGPSTPPKLPSKPQKLKAKTKVPGVQVHVQTQTQTHASSSSPVTTSMKEKPIPSTSVSTSRDLGTRRDSTTRKEKQSTIARDKQKFPVAPPQMKPWSPLKTKPKPRLPTRTPSQSAPKFADVGFIPGRSFVGRVLEVGWELGDEVFRRGEWVVGLVDVRKCGALAEFIVVDRHRVHRVPHPRKTVPVNDPNAPASPIWVGSSPLPEVSLSLSKKQHRGREETKTNKVTRQDANDESTIGISTKSLPVLTLEELALLPLCGIPAYRAVRTFMYAFSGSGIEVAKSPSSPDYPSHDHQDKRRRALVLRGHDGVGAMAVQMLIRQGWRVSVHVPFACVPADATQDLADEFMRSVEDRAREWGADEVIFDDGEAEGGANGEVGDGDDGRAAAVRVIETLREEGDVFDAVLDSVGGKEVREAGEKLLRSNGFQPPAAAAADSSGWYAPSSGSPNVVVNKSKRHGIGQFTTLVGDTPERPIPSAADAFRANLRSFRFGLNDKQDGIGGGNNNKANNGNTINANGDIVEGNNVQGKVGYAWVSIAHEVSEWEGEDVGGTLGAVLKLAMEEGIRPLVEDVGGGMLGRHRVVPFEKAPGVFVDNGPLADGGTVVVRVAG